MKPSKEQKRIVEKLANRNITVSAVPGSGKTTTIKFVVEKYPDKNIWVLTYSKKLQIETRIKFRKLKNTRIMTFHGMACKCYGESVNNDKKLIEIGVNEPEHVPMIDILILDECQDITEWVSKFLEKIIHTNLEMWILMLGDPKQRVSDKVREIDVKNCFLEFINNVTKKYNISRKHRYLKLTESFRLTPANSTFLNECANTEIIGKSQNDNLKPILIPNGEYLNRRPDIVYFLINQIKKFGAENTLILANSIKSKSEHMNPPETFERIILEQIPRCKIFKQESETDHTELMTKGKLWFVTNVGSKGLEKDLVIVFGFSSRGFYHAHTDGIIEPHLYVACSRVKKQLILIGDIGTYPLPFINRCDLEIMCNVICPIRIGIPTDSKKIISRKVTDLISRISPHKEIAIEKILDLPNDLFNEIPTKILQAATIYGPKDENSVWSILGQAVEIYISYSIGIDIFDWYELDGNSKPSSALDFLKMGKEWHMKNTSISNHVFKQVKENLIKLTDKNLTKFLKSIRTCVKDIDTFEKGYLINKIIGNTRIMGIPDYIKLKKTTAKIVELKCTKKFEVRDYIQILIYAYLLSEEFPDLLDIKCFLVNVNTGEYISFRYSKHRKDIDTILQMFL